MKKKELQNKYLENPTLILEWNISLFLLNTFSALSDTLKWIKKEFHLKFLFFNRKIIKEILNNEDKVLKLDQESINANSLESLLYLYYIINDDMYILNYSYDFDIINDLKQKIAKEQSSLRKFILYILAYPIIYNYEGDKDSNSSSEEEFAKKFYKEREEYLSSHQQILKEFNPSLDFKFNESSNIDEIYAQIIISLIKNKILDIYEKAKNIFEQMDFEHIELTHELYIQLKNFFNENDEKEYINRYKIDNLEEPINEKNINFYFILFKYIFKSSIYIYNIEFLLEARQKIVEVAKNNFSKIISIEKSEEYKEKLNYILKKFLDVEYYYILEQSFLKLYTNFEYLFSDSKDKETKAIEKIIDKEDVVKIKLSNYYDEIKKMNKRKEILKFFFNTNKRKFSKLSNEYKMIVNNWNETEKFIHEKKINKIKNKNVIFTYFNDINNKNVLLEIFSQEEIDNFKNNCINIKNMTIINNYYKKYYFESRKKSISKIDDFLESDVELGLNELDEYLKDLKLAKEMNDKYELINFLFFPKKKEISEEEINTFLDQWKKIENQFEEKNIDNIDMEIIIKLIKFFTNKDNQIRYLQFMSENSYNLLIDKKEKVKEEILNYYKNFCPESKAKDIKSIENSGIKEKDLSIFFRARDLNIKKDTIFLFINKNQINNESEIQKAVEKWSEIEKEIKNKKLQRIETIIRLKLLNSFNSGNTFLSQLIDKEKLEASLTENLNETSETNSESQPSTSVSSNCKKKKKKKKGKKGKIKTNLNLTISSQNSQETLEKSSNTISNFSELPVKTDSESFLTERKDKYTEENEEKEEIREELKDNKSEYYYRNLSNSNLIFSFEKKDENKIIKIELEGNKFSIDLNDFNYCKDYFSKDRKSKGYILFDYLSELLEKLENELENNFELKFKLNISYIENDFIFNFEYLPQKKDKQPIHFKEYNFFSEIFDYMLEIINSEKVVNEKEVSSSSIINNNNKYKPGSHTILEFLRVIGNHNEKGGKHTAEFIIETEGNNNKIYISGGLDASIKIYSNNEFDCEYTIKSKDIVYGIRQISKGCEPLEFLACTNKEIFLYKKKEDFKAATEEYFESNPFSLNVDDNMNYTNCLVINENDAQKLIFSGKNGSICYIKSSTDNAIINKFTIIEKRYYRGLVNIDDNLIALTSNEVLLNGEDKLVIFNLKKKIVEKEIIRDSDNFNYSFIASSNGLAIITLEEKKEIYLMCACKKYSERHKNGILLVNIKNEYNSSFFDTEGFEVYCFCQIKKKLNKAIIQNINEQKEQAEETEFFLVGGFDKDVREGKIKLFKLVDDENNKKKIKFLQDIVFDTNNNIPDKEENSGPITTPDNKKEEANVDATVMNLSKFDDNQIKDNKPKEKFYGFKGAISCIIQSKVDWKILASSYDGKIYLFSKPKLDLYKNEETIN